MTKKFFVLIICFTSVFTASIFGEQKDIKEFVGVITLHNIPAKVIKINEIEENPKPGTSYIGQKYLIVEVGEIPEVMANWTVVKVSYVEYPEPKTIEYELFSEKRKIKVKYHSVGFEITGDLSVYMKE